MAMSLRRADRLDSPVGEEAFDLANYKRRHHLPDQSSSDGD